MGGVCQRVGTSCFRSKALIIPLVGKAWDRNSIGIHMNVSINIGMVCAFCSADFMFHIGVS